MIYTPENCHPQCICHHDGVLVKNVFKIDTNTNTALCYEDPPRIVGNEVVFCEMRFDGVDIEFHPEISEMPTEFEFYGLRLL